MPRRSRSVREIAEEPFDHVEPRTAGRGEVHVKARMACQPLLHLRMLVRGVVVGDQVQFFAGRRQLVDHAEKLQPLLMTMPVVAHADHGAIQRVHGREQRGGSVSLVVVGHGSAAPLLQRQPGLRAVQRLDLALLIGAKHDGMFRRVEIEPNDGFQFLGELPDRC